MVEKPLLTLYNSIQIDVDFNLYVRKTRGDIEKRRN
jgi:hypothetical protein